MIRGGGAFAVHGLVVAFVIVASRSPWWISRSPRADSSSASSSIKDAGKVAVAPHADHAPLIAHVDAV